MKNFKRILAAIGAILLFGMYASTLIFAFIDHSKTMGLLKASIACTIIIPVLLYAYTLVYKISKPEQDETLQNDFGSDMSQQNDSVPDVSQQNDSAPTPNQQTDPKPGKTSQNN